MTLACQHDPERWFDRRRRGRALTHCFACPVRPWCAQQALKCHASWGVWAGVWIDGRHDDAAPYLHAIAADTAGPGDPHPQTASTDASEVPPAPAPAPEPAPLRRPSAATVSGSVPAAVLARSSGHCEILTDSCRYSLDRVVNRAGGDVPAENPSPARLFAACAVCAEIVACLEPQLAARLGYLVDAGRDPACVPFHWRGSRWVLLDRDGWLTELGQDAQSA
ncbi:WhiB family transcriptional regulator [Mycobacterium heidelbergense]|uniref:WhiB family transcriptional regulator n=1 Tax=Mycobacterium heidelbergense TaxID=53376 RepID=UPI003CF84811